LNEVIERIFKSGYVEDAQGNTYQPISSITFETGALLYDFIRAFRPQKTLEIGMAYGISTLFICQALRDNGLGSHTAIDPLEESEFKSVGLLNAERANLRDLLQFHEAPSDLALPRFCTEGERFDFAFIDGWHLFDFTLVDFYYIDKLLGVGGYVAFDDLWMPAIRKVISFVLHNKRYQLVSITSRCPAPLWRRVFRIARRVAQNPLGRDWMLNFLPNNVAFLKKVAADDRSWRFHRAF
jgi:predicted O-methyltransferase YrrM